MTEHELVERVVRSVDVRLPRGRAAWVNPTGYHGSLALCVIDSIQSLGVRYRSVEHVVQRYRNVRGASAETDGAAELLKTFQERGVDGWVQDIGNRNRTSSQADAPLKATAIRAAASALTLAGVSTTGILRALDDDERVKLKDVWLATPGQCSGISWRYFLMLAGVPGVKADRMICRFVQKASGVRKPAISPGSAGRAVEGAAHHLANRPRPRDLAFRVGARVRSSPEN